MFKPELMLNGGGDFVSEESRLKRLCRRSYKFKLISSPFWTAEIYGFGLQISKYGYYPYFLPLCVYTDHGPGYYDEIPDHEIKSGAPVHLFHSPNSVRLWDAFMPNKSVCFYSPFVFYRKRRKITAEQEACGTIAFPAHSTPSIDDDTGYSGYIRSLKALPERYHPIAVCLHMHDINKGLHRVFIEAGFKVETAGNTSNQNFVSRFYSVVKKYKYATSNVVGSYAYYCVEMNIPFFIYGEKPGWVNFGDKNIPSGRYAPWENGYGKIVDELFQAGESLQEGPHVTLRQRNFVEKHLGVEDGVSRGQMAVILYGSFLKFILSPAGILHLALNNFAVIAIKKFLVDFFVMANKEGLWFKGRNTR